MNLDHLPRLLLFEKGSSGMSEGTIVPYLSGKKYYQIAASPGPKRVPQLPVAASRLPSLTLSMLLK